MVDLRHQVVYGSQCLVILLDKGMQLHRNRLNNMLG